MQLAQTSPGLEGAQYPQMEIEVLEEMVTREAVLQEGLTHPPTNLEAQVKEQIEMVTNRLGGEEKLKEALAETGVSLDEYNRRMRENFIIQSTVRDAVEAKATVTADEVKEFYEKNREKFRMPETVRASHILVMVPADASDDVKKAKKAQIDAARTLVTGGKPFADVAKEVSECPSKAQGGDLGYFPRGRMVPEFDTAAFSLPTNQVSEVITTQFGYHVLLVTDRKPAGDQSLDEVKERLENYLKTRKGSDMAQEYVKGLREKAKVEMLLKPVEMPKPAPVVETPPVEAPNQ